MTLPELDEVAHDLARDQRTNESIADALDNLLERFAIDHPDMLETDRDRIAASAVRLRERVNPRNTSFRARLEEIVRRAARRDSRAGSGDMMDFGMSVAIITWREAVAHANRSRK